MLSIPALGTTEPPMQLLHRYGTKHGYKFKRDMGSEAFPSIKYAGFRLTIKPIECKTTNFYRNKPSKSLIYMAPPHGKINFNNVFTINNLKE